MVVLGIVTGLVMLALPRLGGQNNQMRQTLRRLTSITRELQTTAKLQGTVYRLVIDMGTDEKNTHKFWIEKGSAKSVLNPTEMDDMEEKLGRGRDDEKKPPPMFTTDTKFIKEPMALPGDLKFEDVELKRKDQPVTKGKAYIHFFPQGLADEAVIHLRGGEKLRWSMIVHPLTGKTTVIDEHVTLKDLQ
jgi:hypothetical protein